MVQEKLKVQHKAPLGNKQYKKKTVFIKLFHENQGYKTNRCQNSVLEKHLCLKPGLEVFGKLKEKIKIDLSSRSYFSDQKSVENNLMQVQNYINKTMIISPTTTFQQIHFQKKNSRF